MPTPILPLYGVRHSLVDDFDYLINELDSLASLYEQHPQPMWGLKERASSAWLRRVLFDLWYEDGQPGNFSRTHIGMVGANEVQLEQVARVNAAKDAFNDAVQALRQKPSNVLTAEREKIQAYAADRRHLLGYAALGRLHLKQTFRRLPTPPGRLLSVYFLWYRNGRSIRRVSVREAEAMLDACHNNDAPHIRIQRQILASIPDKEPLARVRNLAPIMRVNMALESPDADLKDQRSQSISMPLFVPLAPGEPLPDHNIPDKEPSDRPRGAVRCDTKIEDEVFLRSLRIHRYKEGFRNPRP